MILSFKVNNFLVGSRRLLRWDFAVLGAVKTTYVAGSCVGSKAQDKTGSWERCSSKTHDGTRSASVSAISI